MPSVRDESRNFGDKLWYTRIKSVVGLCCSRAEGRILLEIRVLAATWPKE